MDQPTRPVFLTGGGETGALMRALAWEETPLGAPAAWPPELSTLVGVMLGSRQPMLIVWGPARTTLYNDGYAAMCGNRHPAALGRPFEELWFDIWPLVEPILDRAYAGVATHMDDIEFTMHRNGYPEETHFAFSYTPVTMADGTVGGMFCACTETTEQVAARRAAAQAAQHQRLLLQNMPGFVAFLSGPTHVFEYVNEAYVAISGNRDFLGRTVREVFPEIAGQGFYELLDGVYSTGRPYAVRSTPIRLGDEAEDRYIDLLYQPIRSESGAVVGIFVGGYDVTEAQRSIRSLAESEERLRALVSASSEVLYGHNADWSAMMALSGGNFLADTTTADPNWFGAYIPEDEQPRVRAAIDHAIATKSVFELEHRVRQLDGRIGWTLSRSVPLLDASGEIREWFGAAADVTERRAAEEALRESEARLRLLDAIGEATAPLLDAGEILVVTTRLVGEHMGVSTCAYADMDPDQDGFTIRGDWTAPGSQSIVGHYRLADFGRLAVRSLGAGLPLVVNDNLAELAPEEAATFQAIGIGSTICMPLVKDGRLTALMAIHHKGPHRWTPAELALIREVTERSWAHVERAATAAELKASAQALAVLNAGLEARVAERTGELMAAEESLRQSQKMEAVGQLTGGLAHDFNNLLAGISGSLELMQARIRQGRTGELDRYIDGAQDAARRAAALTHRLLAFSRRQTLDPKPTDVARLVAGMEDLVRRTVGPAITVETHAKGGPWSVLVDASQLENALLNLCINARDAMPGGGRITIETGNRRLDAQAARERDLPPGDYVSLCVADDGTGMTGDVIERAFDPFFTTKPIGVGTGLGLSMIYGFARQSGGQVRIRSEVGRGTTVCVYLPSHHLEEAAAAPAADPGAAAPAGAGETVLVIDDEPLVRMLVVDVLEELGYAALEAGDGPEGMRIMRSDARLDLLITDVGLPNGMNGRQVADAARELRPGLKVLFVTGYAESAVLGHGHLDPGMQVVTKPFDLAQLGSRIRAMMESGA